MNLHTPFLLSSALLFILFFSYSPHSGVAGQVPQLFINEFLASNNSSASDEDGDSPDWIELYNAGNDTIRLLDASITDDEADPGRWRFPKVDLEPGGFLIVWASGKDRSNSQLHTNFKLSAAGEFIGVYDADGQLIDEVEFGAQQPDISQARIPDGSGTFEATASPTPGVANERNVPPSHAVEFLPESGFFTASVRVELSSSVSGATVHYTTDGSSVNAGSPTYNGPVEIAETTVIRARAFQGNTKVSDDISQIYLVDYDGTLPVLSYATDNANLYGQAGIFDNPDEVGREWERPVSVNYVVPNGRGFRINAGMRTHGGRSRRDEFPKLATRLYFRSDYGESKLRYRVFDSRKNNTFDRLLVHSGGSSDQFHRKIDKVNLQWSLIRDPLNHRMWREHDGAVSASQPVVLFINGKSWGIYHLRERVDESYLEANYDILSADLLRPDNDQLDIEAGDKRAWNSMFSFIKRKDMDNQANYERAQELIDIDNLIDFHVFNVFAGNWDMPHTNIYFFRERSDGAQWRWVMWDTDISYGSLGSGLPPSTRTLEWATRDSLLEGVAGTTDDEDWLWTTLILRRLLDNDDFETRFANRFADLMNTTLHPNHIAELVDEMANVLRPNIHFETDAWSKATRDDWENGIEVIKDWAEARPKHQRDHLRKVLDVGGDREVRLEVVGQGKIRINSIKPKTYPWQGVYFRNVPVRLEALPKDGYVFSHWRGLEPSTLTAVTVDLESDRTITASFEPIGGQPEPLIDFFLPDSGSPGTVVSILGQHFETSTQVTFNGLAAAFHVVSDSSLSASVPDSATTGKLVVTTAGGSAESDREFVVVAPPPEPPELISFEPDSGLVGTEVEILGKRLRQVTGVWFGGRAADFQVASDSSLTATVPDSAESGFIALVAASGRATSVDSFVVLPPTPVQPELLAMAPESGLFGDTIWLHGTRLSSTQRVFFNDVSAPLLETATDSLVITEVPASATSGFLAIQAMADTVVSSLNFTVLHDSSAVDTAKFMVEADAYVRSDQDSSNFGEHETLRVRRTPDGQLVSYLRFDVRGLDRTVRSAMMHLYLLAGGSSATVFSAANDWDENGLTWINSPAPLVEALDKIAVGTTRGPVQFDVSSAISGNGEYSFVISADSPTEIKFSSREGLFPARLEVRVDSTLVSVAKDGVLPSEYELAPAYPNPFNAETTIQYALPQTGLIRLTIFNVTGQIVRTLVDRVQPAGYHVERWDGRDEHGNLVGSGVYFVRLTAGSRFISTVVTLQK